MPQILPPKKDVALALLERASVFVHLDPRAAGVVVPVQFKKQPRLVLQIGLNMPVPIVDLRLDDQGLSCTLSFNRTPFHCVVPWPGIFALVGEDGRGMVWPNDVPQEIAREMAPARDADGAADAPPAAGTPNAGSGKKKPHVALVTEPKRIGPVSAASASKRNVGSSRPRRKRDEGGEPTKPSLGLVPKAPPSADTLDTKERPDKLSREPREKRPSHQEPQKSASHKPENTRRGESVHAPDRSQKPDGSHKHGPSYKPDAHKQASQKADADAHESAQETAPQRTHVSRPHQPGKKAPRKELPPYLRVVK